MVGADLLSFWSARTSLSLLGSHETGGETTEAGSKCGRSSLSAPHIAPLCAIGRTIAHHYALLCATACYRPCLLRKCEMGYAAFANMLRLQNGQPSCHHVCKRDRVVCRRALYADLGGCRKACMQTTKTCLQIRFMHLQTLHMHCVLADSLRTFANGSNLFANE